MHRMRMELVEMVATVRDVVPMDQTDEILKQCKWWWCGVSVRHALCKMGATGGVVVRQALVGERWVSSSVIRRVNQGRKCREGMRGCRKESVRHVGADVTGGDWRSFPGRALGALSWTPRALVTATTHESCPANPEPTPSATHARPCPSPSPALPSDLSSARLTPADDFSRGSERVTKP